VAIRYNKQLYRERNRIERVIGHLNINRAIATRYDQLADSFLGVLYTATARYWIKFVHAAYRALVRIFETDKTSATVTYRVTAWCIHDQP
jgi:hypothetical protein